MAGEANTKVYFKQGGEELVVGNGGKITVDPGGEIAGTLAGVSFDPDYFTVSEGVVTLHEDVVALLELVENIPTADPEVAGEVWNENGTLKVSAGA